MKIFKVLIPILFLAFSTAVSAQKFRYYKYEGEQIPFKKINQVLLDHKGFSWLATDNGLYRFDGISFEDHNHTFKSKYIKGFSKWKNDTIIMANDNGIFKLFYNIKGPAFEPFLLRESTPALSYPEGVFVDSKNRIWIPQNSNSVFVLDGDDSRSITYKDDQVNGSIPVFGEDNDGHVWMLVPNDALYRYDYESKSFTEVISQQNTLNMLVDEDVLWLTGDSIQRYRITSGKLRIDSPLIIAPDLQVHYIAKDLEGLIFLSSDQGMYTLDPRSPTIQLEKTYGSNDPHRIVELPFRNINDLFFTPNEIRRGGNIWVSTDDGLGILWTSYFQSVSGMSHDNVFSISDGISGEVLISQGEVSKVELIFAEEQWERIGQLSNVTGITSTSNDIWLSTSDAKIHQFRNGVKIKTFDFSDRGGGIFYLTSDSYDNIWFCQAPTVTPIQGVGMINSQGVFKEYGPEHGFNSRVLVLNEGGRTELYAAGIGSSSYLYKFNADTDSFENRSLPFSFEVGENFEVHDISVDDSGIVWLATTDGLLKYDTERIQRIDLGVRTRTEIRSLTSLADSNLWLATDTNGLIHLDAHGNHVVFDEQCGTPSKVTSYRSMLTDDRGRLWVGTAEGAVYSFQANPLPLISATPEFKKVEINSKNQTNAGSIGFSGKDKAVFQFAPKVFPSLNIGYQYRVIDQELPVEDQEAVPWSDQIESPVVEITDQFPGNYTVEFRTRQAGGYSWSEPSSVDFQISQVWYKTSWGIALQIILGALFFWFFVRRWYLKKSESLRLTLDQKKQELSEKELQLAEKSETVTHQLREIKHSGVNLYLLHRLIRQIPKNGTWTEILNTVSKIVDWPSGLDAFELGHQKEHIIEFKRRGHNSNKLEEYELEFNEKANMPSFAISENKIIELQDYNSEVNKLINSTADSDFASCIYIPFKLKDQSVMILCVYRFKEDAFTESDAMLIQILSSFLSHQTIDSW